MTDGASNVTYRAYIEKLGGTKADEYVGNEGDLFYDRTNGRVYRVIYMLTNISGGYKGVITAETLV